MHHPFRYIRAVVIQNLVYPLSKKGVTTTAHLISGQTIKVVLPSATDLYLAGCKTDDSEIRLTRFLIHQLNKGDVFFDAGAHFGFYSLLASSLVGSAGKVLSVEASPTTFQVLKENIGTEKNILSFHCVLGSKQGAVTFFEFPVRYAEYNSVSVKQYENEKWFLANRPSEKKIDAMTVDSILQQSGLRPAVIKIDVEGGEWEVIKGLQTFLSQHNPVIVMEFVTGNPENSPYVLAEKLLHSIGYKPHWIDASGTPVLLTQSTNQIVHNTGKRSDNIVYLR
jgi:FkbM family methyltransferase